MSNKIKIDVEALSTELALLKTSIDQFTPFTKKYTKELATRFNGFNSDFVDQFKDLLENMTDSTGDKIIKELNYFHQNIEQTIQTMTEIDENLSKLGEK